MSDDPRTSDLFDRWERVWHKGQNDLRVNQSFHMSVSSGAPAILLLRRCRAHPVFDRIA